MTEIWTDGGCHGNPGPGGWAWVRRNEDGTFLEARGAELSTTNNRMELSAVIDALQKAKSGNWSLPLYIHTDSQYVQLGISTWIKGWVRNGWKTASKQPVKNKDLWMVLHELDQSVQVEWKWVKGHAGNLQNERCDELVQEAIHALS